MNQPRQINVLVLHEKPIVGAGIAAALNEVPSLAISRRAPGCLEDLDRARRAEIVVADYSTALALQRPDHGHRPRTVIVSQSCSEWELRSAIKAGVEGYLLLSCDEDEVVRGVLKVSEGSRYLCGEAAQVIADSLTHEQLSGREAEVLSHLVGGASNKRIAIDLGISVGTVKAHVKSILQKLDARSRTEAASVATKRGLAWASARRTAMPLQGPRGN